jgi:hypothetical protein
MSSHQIVALFIPAAFSSALRVPARRQTPPLRHTSLHSCCSPVMFRLSKPIRTLSCVQTALPRSGRRSAWIPPLLGRLHALLAPGELSGSRFRDTRYAIGGVLETACELACLSLCDSVASNEKVDVGSHPSQILGACLPCWFSRGTAAEDPPSSIFIHTKRPGCHGSNKKAMSMQDAGCRIGIANPRQRAWVEWPNAELRYIARLLGLHVLKLFSFIEANLDAFRRLEHDVAAEHRKFLLPALNPLVRLQDPYYCVRHFRQRKILACNMTLERGLSISSPADIVVVDEYTHQCIFEDHR